MLKSNQNQVLCSLTANRRQEEHQHYEQGQFVQCPMQCLKNNHGKTARACQIIIKASNRKNPTTSLQASLQSHSSKTHKGPLHRLDSHCPAGRCMLMASLLCFFCFFYSHEHITNNFVDISYKHKWNSHCECTVCKAYLAQQLLWACVMCYVLLVVMCYW